MRYAWLLLLPVLTARADLADPGPFASGYRQVSITRPADQGGGVFTARLHYPAAAPGQNTPIDPAGGPYPVISFGHGFVQSVTVYQSTLAHLASHGFLVIATESEGGLFPSHANFARDMLVCLTYLRDQNTTAGSFVFGLVDAENLGVSGHSMGGGACILAAAQRPDLVDALAPLAAANTNPSAVAAAAQLRGAARYIVGSQDSIVPPANTRPMHDATPSSRQFITLAGGSHCGFIDSSGFGCDSGAMTRADQLRLVRRELTEFFLLHLKHEQEHWAPVWSPFFQSDARETIERRPEIDLTLSDIHVTARTGGTTRAPVAGTNVGPSATDVRFLPESAPGWVSASPVVVSAGAGAAFGSELFVSPSGGTPAGEYSLFLTARAERDGATRDAARVRVAVRCGADFNADDQVDFFDYLDFAGAFADDEPSADMNGDSQVDFFDYLDFAAVYELGC